MTFTCHTAHGVAVSTVLNSTDHRPIDIPPCSIADATRRCYELAKGRNFSIDFRTAGHPERHFNCELPLR